MWGNFSRLMSNLLVSNTLYFDGSHTNQFTKSGAGCVILDNNGNLVVAAAYNLGDIDPQNVAIVEATALLNGLRLAQSKEIKVDQVKGDNKEVIDHVRGQSWRGPKPGHLSDIIVEIKRILEVLKIDPFSNIELISREGNEVADSLASEGSTLSCISKVYNSEYELPAKTAQLVRRKKSLNGSGGGGGGGSGGGGSSGGGGPSRNTGLLETVGMAGAAVAGIAMLGYGVSKLFQDDDPENKHKGKANSRLIEPKFHVLHVDGLDSNQLEQAAAGCIIRDKDGELVVASAYNLDYCYPGCHIGVAEAMALKKGLELAIEQKIKLDLIKVDNKEVFDRVLGTDPKPPKERTLIQVIKEIKDYLDDLSIDPETQLILISSDDNQVADELANIGRGLRNRENKYYYKGSPDIPLKLANLIIDEKK